MSLLLLDPCPGPQEAMSYLDELNAGGTPPPVDMDCLGPGGSLLHDTPAIVANSVFGPAVEDTKRGLVDVTQGLTTFWLNVPDPELGGADGTPTGTVAFLWDRTAWIAAAMLVIAIIWAGVRIIMAAMSGEDGRPRVRELATLMVTYIVVSSASVAVITALLAFADGFSGWVISKSTEGTAFGDHLLTLLSYPLSSGLLTLIMLILAALVALAQVCVMVIRGGVLIVLTGTLLVTATVVNTDTGRAAFRKQVAWILAFILYKPVAAIVYAAAFRLMGTPTTADNAVVTIASGIAVMLLAIFTLPALMRLITPMVAPTAQGGGAGMAAVGIAATVATAGRLAVGRGK